MKVCAKCNAPVATKRCAPCLVEWSARYYEKNKEKIDASTKKWKSENIERVRELDRARRAANLESVRARRRELYQKNAAKNAKYSNDWYWANIDKARATACKAAKKWRTENPALVKAESAIKRAIRVVARPTWANDFFIEEIYDLAKRRSGVTGQVWQVDHIVPLRSNTVCGLHVEANLQIVVATVNCSKGNRHWPDMP